MELVIRARKKRLWIQILFSAMRQVGLGVGPLQGHAGKEADVEIEEDSADKKEYTLGLASRHKRSFSLAMDQTKLPIDTGQRLVLGAMKLAVITC